MKVKHLLLIIIVITLGIFSFIKIKNIYETSKKDINISNEEETISNFISIFLETGIDSGEYSESTKSTWPGKIYSFNETLSTCENGSTLTWDSTNNGVKFSGNKTDICYAYFDKIIDTSGLDTTKTDCSLSIVFEKGSTDFRLYRVASIDEDGYYNLVKPFIGYTLDYEGTFITNMNMYESTYSDYILLTSSLADYVSATSEETNNYITASGATDAAGEYTFENLETGLYLILGEPLYEAGTRYDETGNYIYTPEDSIVIIPAYLNNSEELEYEYNPVSNIMYTESWIPDDEEY